MSLFEWLNRKLRWYTNPDRKIPRGIYSARVEEEARQMESLFPWDRDTIRIALLSDPLDPDLALDGDPDIPPWVNR